MPRDILPLVKETSENLLILGKAGVGKSTLIKVVKKHFGKKCIILCPTGIAAQNVKGITIHSYFSLPLVHTYSQREINNCVSKLRASENLDRLLEIETLIIDEISMVNSMVFDAIDRILRTALNVNLPFGGKRLILIGDIFQLPPIDKDNEQLDDIFFWKSAAYLRGGFTRLELRKVYRLNVSEENKTFEQVLDNLRLYQSTSRDLAFLNRYYSPNQNLINTTVLCTRNSDVQQYNNQGLEGLNSRLYRFEADFSSTFPKKEQPVPTELKIAVGAPVIFIRNDSNGSYKNGTRGTVIAIDYLNKIIKVVTEKQEEVSVGYVEWGPTKNNDSTKTTLVYFRHFPLILGWALTIHRCQGLTMSKVHLDLGLGAFAPGQLYVALSRLRDISGLSLASQLRMNDLVESEETLRFYHESIFEEVNLNLSNAELSTVDIQNEVLRTIHGNQLNSRELSIQLFNQGLDLEEILQERIRLGFKEILPKTIIGHLIESYEEVDSEELKDFLFITNELEEEICEELRERNDIENCSLKDIRNSLSNPEIDYDKLKVILYANGLKTPPSPSRKKMKSPVEIPKAEPTRQLDRNLFEILRVLRLEKANEKSVQPFQIFHNSSLEEMALIKPVTRSEFLNIAGVGRLKLEEFGEEFLEAIRGYCGLDQKASNNYSELDSQLFEELKKLRNTLALERGLPPYCIFNNETLKEMATLKPITKTQFIKIVGIGEIKLNDFGDRFISCIKEYI